MSEVFVVDMGIHENRFLVFLDMIVLNFLDQGIYCNIAMV